jgi:hypothetical protein
MKIAFGDGILLSGPAYHTVNAVNTQLFEQ